MFIRILPKDNSNKPTDNVIGLQTEDIFISRINTLVKVKRDLYCCTSQVIDCGLSRISSTME